MIINGNILDLILVALISFIASFILHNYLFEKEKKHFVEKHKKLIENFLAINISHLHDSANLFNLIKNNAEEQKIINFATGAAYHYRSIFNSLKKTFFVIQNQNFKNLNEDTISQLIAKEEIDLKDLINIELFQLGNFSEIEIEDHTKSNYAFIYGNFDLLTKVVLNLVENALKYSNTKIKIILTEINNRYILKIMSFGKSISEEIKTKINNQIYKDLEGHGLSSLVEIMNYHNANIEISSIQDEASSINLEFEKFIATCKKPIIKKAFNNKKNKQFVWLPIVGLIALIFFLKANHLDFTKTNQNTISQNRDFLRLEQMIDKETENLNLKLDL